MIKKTGKTALFALLFLAVWNGLEYLYSTLITRSGYHFTAGADLWMPLGLAVILGYLLIYRRES